MLVLLKERKISEKSNFDYLEQPTKATFPDQPRTLPSIHPCQPAYVSILPYWDVIPGLWTAIFSLYQLGDISEILPQLLPYFQVWKEKNFSFGTYWLSTVYEQSEFCLLIITLPCQLQSTHSRHAPPPRIPTRNILKIILVEIIHVLGITENLSYKICSVRMMNCF